MISVLSKFLQPNARMQRKEHKDRVQVYPSVALHCDMHQCLSCSDAMQCLTLHCEPTFTLWLIYRPGMAGVIQQSPQQQKDSMMSPSAAGTLYPDLMDYTIISMPQGSVATAGDIQTLLPQAKQLSELLQANVGALETMVMRSTKGTVTISNNHALIKIGRPTEWVCVSVSESGGEGERGKEGGGERERERERGGESRLLPYPTFQVQRGRYCSLPSCEASPQQIHSTCCASFRKT